MASPTAPTHGKYGAIYRARPNGFNGVGLNDLTWGSAATNAATSYYEVVIDGNGAPDTFKWRKNGGAWTATVAITGAAQTLDEAQTITFGATTGHTLTDQWSIGNLVSEACTESGATAQITDATKRMLRPDNPPTFTDAGGETVLYIDYASGTAHFTGNVGVVTVSGNLAFVYQAGLQQVGYLTDWTMDATLEMADMSAQGDSWKTALPGITSCTGSADSFLIGNESALDAISEAAGSGGEAFYALRLFQYDPDDDATGDHWDAMATITGLSPATTIGAVVKDPLRFECFGLPVFTANS